MRERFHSRMCNREGQVDKIFNYTDTPYIQHKIHYLNSMILLMFVLVLIDENRSKKQEKGQLEPTQLLMRELDCLFLSSFWCLQRKICVSIASSRPH